MTTLDRMRNTLLEDGLDYTNATSRAAQEAILDLIAKSKLSSNVTIKGGVLIQQISKDKRRATTDLDFDFIRYPINDRSIHLFVKELNDGLSEFSISIEGPIEELKQHDYYGKRVHVSIGDKAGNTVVTKIDIGVNTLIGVDQEELCFNLSTLEEGVTLLGNSNEQVVAEKLRSLLRIGTASTRYKDVFDIYYLLIIKGVRTKELKQALTSLIFNDNAMRENAPSDIQRRLAHILYNRRFKSQLARAKNNWLQVSPNKVADALVAYFEQ